MSVFFTQNKHLIVNLKDFRVKKEQLVQCKLFSTHI